MPLHKGESLLSGLQLLVVSGFEEEITLTDEKVLFKMHKKDEHETWMAK